MSNFLFFVLRFLFAACIVALATLAWLPAAAMPRTALGGHSEHFLAYFGTVIVAGLAFQKAPAVPVQCAFLCVYASILEAGQVMAPGRHASFEDLAFSCLGIAVGGLVLWLGRPRMPTWLRA